MAYVTPLYGGSDAQVDYRLGLEHGCDQDAQFSYHADARERPLRWIGEGLQAFEVEGLVAGAELTAAQHDMARRLIRGQHPVTGEQLVTPKVAVPAAAKVQLGPLVAAINEAAHGRGVDAGSLFEGRLAKAWATAERGVARRGGRAVARVDQAAALAEAAGLDPAAVWGAERVGEARAALWEPRPVVGEDGRPVLGADGEPVTEMVEARERVGIAGFDIGITLPKSLSVLLAMAPDELVGRVEDVYGQAAVKTFDWVEGRTSYVKRGHHGDGQAARHERSSGMSGWVMTHRAARPVGEAPIGDPHWHVHITVANMAQAPDGTWLTVAAGGRELMRHAPAIDKVTQAQIRAELRAEFGITFARAEDTGLWEVEHIPDGALKLFSKRGAQVNDVLEQLGYTPGTVSPKESRVLTRACRSGKSETTSAADVTLREYWRAQAISEGYDPADWMPAVLANFEAGLAGGRDRASERANETMSARYGATLDEVVARVTDPDTGLTAGTRRFSHLDALAAVADALPHGAAVAEVERLTGLVLAHPMFVELPARGGRDGQSDGKHQQLAGSHDMAGGQLFTTGDVKAAEQTILDAIGRAHHDQGMAVVEPGVLEMAVTVSEAAQGYALSAEQRAALDALVGNGRAVESILGAAGAGKTTLMRTARVAYEGQGLVVAGAATAARAVQELAAESGIDSRTVAQWRYRIENGHGLAGVDVLVLDEANLTDDRDRALLYQAAEQSGTKIVEIGDPKQLRAVGCGSMFGYINTALDGPKLVENRRQLAEDERAALAAWRDGRHGDALTSYAGGGQVVATHTADQGVAAMVATWMRAARGAPDPHKLADGLLVLAKTNEQVTRINTAVQAVRAEEGQLGEGTEFLLPTGQRVMFRVGDQVILRRNDRHAEMVKGEGVLNGYRAVVTEVDPAGVRVVWHQPDDLPGQDAYTTLCTPEYIADGGLDLGYCLTTHKAEGMTIGGQWERPDGTRNDGTVLVWGPGMDNPGLYVSLSRDKGRTVLFASLDEVEGEGEQLRYGTPRDQAELTARVVAALAERATATETTANDRPVLVDLGQAPAQDQDTRRDRDVDEPTQEPDLGQAPPPAQPEPEFESGELDTSALSTQELVDLAVASLNDPTAGGDPEPAPADTELDDEHLDDEPVDVTDEQRRRWAELRDRTAAARRSGDAVADQAAREDQRAYAEHIGPDRAHQLHREAMEQFERRNDERREALRRITLAAEWRARPHSELTDQQLQQATVDAQLKRDGLRNQAERAQARLDELEEAVTTGRGPLVSKFDSELVELRRLAELDHALEQLARRREQLRHTADKGRYQAIGKRFEADRQPWYRPGRRDELLADAANIQANVDRALAGAAELSEQLRELVEQRNEQQARTMSGGLRPGQAGRQLEYAENTREQARAEQQRRDEAEVDRLRRTARPDAADDAEARHTALATEYELRAAMPDDQAAVERNLRAAWRTEQARIQRERAAKRDEEASWLRRSHTQDHTRDRGQDFSR